MPPVNTDIDAARVRVTEARAARDAIRIMLRESVEAISWAEDGLRDAEEALFRCFPCADCGAAPGDACRDSGESPAHPARRRLYDITHPR
jgi:hypothetical protein